MEKEQFIQQNRPASPSSIDRERPQRLLQDARWQPGFVRRFPWIGFASIVVALGCAAASVAVLVTSNGQSVTRWPKAIAPNVLINIMSSIENICFLTAVGMVATRAGKSRS